MLDFSLLRSKQWRDEIKEVIEDYTASIKMGQGIMAAEEIAVEASLIKLMLETQSHFLDLKRAHQGIDGYSEGLTIRSESLVKNILALSDLIVTEGLDQDPEATLQEKQDWAVRSKKIQDQVDAYLNGPLAKMKIQVQQSKKTLRLLEEKIAKPPVEGAK